MSTADLRSSDEIEALTAAIRAFASAAREALHEADGAARDQIARIEERKRDLEWEAARLSDEYDSLDEDEDGSYLQDQLHEVNEELDDASAAGAHLEGVHDVFLSGAGELMRIADDTLPAARAFLELKLEQLRAYASLSPPGGAPSADGHAWPGRADRAGALSLPAFRLPPGFTWVPVDEVEVTDLEREDFRKASEEMIQRGFALLVNEILPRMRSGAPVDAEVFRQADRAAGRDEAAGARRAFEAFFGDDAIRLERRTGEPRFSVTDGRHRVEIARRLRLTHVPARAVEVSW